MPTIGLLSDTHGYLDPQVFDYFKDVDQIWHLGDVGNAEIIDQLTQFKPTKAVFGNIDDHNMRRELPEYEYIELEGLVFLLIHIAGLPPKYNRNVRQLLNKQMPKVLLCGHSHIERVTKDKESGIVYINPGAAGKEGFHHFRHLMRMTVQSKKITNLELIKLGKR